MQQVFQSGKHINENIKHLWLGFAPLEKMKGDFCINFN